MHSLKSAVLLTLPLAVLVQLEMAGSLTATAAETTSTLQAQITWGHRSPSGTPFTMLFTGAGVTIDEISGQGLESGDGLKDGLWTSRAGGGDIDGVKLALSFPPVTIQELKAPQRIWADLLAQSDADTVRRLRQDPGFRPDTRKLTIQMDRDGTKGFSVTMDQLLQQREFWLPSLDVYLTASDPPVSFADYMKQLEPFWGRRILDQVRDEPEASYEQYVARWEDMGSPSYRHRSQPAPGHIVGLAWDSSIHKFGIDRGAGVWNDYGNPDRFRFNIDLGHSPTNLAQSWKSQKLADGLPIITTTFEKEDHQYQIQQFAYPLNGPPAERRGDMPMVLLQTVRVIGDWQKSDPVVVKLTHRRPLTATGGLTARPGPRFGWCFEDTATHQVLFSVQGLDSQRFTIEKISAEPAGGDKLAAQWRADSVVLSFWRLPHESHGLVIKLPSPVLSPEDGDKMLALPAEQAWKNTRQFWSDQLSRGAEFTVPEPAVNELFRANLWHALRLPRRHGGQEPGVAIDLPYSNFAYDQKGTPWPVNQAVYVDYMLYDLRGYHDVSVEELLAIYHNNQEASGHLGGVANWVVYTPGMVYAVAQNYLLSNDRAALAKLLPPTLKALDWCLAQIKQGSLASWPAHGLVRGPLNDGTGEGVWAFNQAYVYAALDSFGKVLGRIGHPRAQECLAAAREFRTSVERGFGAASLRSPLVQLRDHTWIPYVPCEVLTPRRLFEQWYPTDVDTGAAHLPRLRALPAAGWLADSLLNDHEDNLYLHGWGMANEPVYNQQGMAYLFRDQPKAAIRTFYSMMACAFSHSVFEPVEHRWTWGQYFGPPSTDGAWFELYRNMLIRETDDDTLLLLQATPRKWLADGKIIEVRRAPTYYGDLTMKIESRAAASTLRAEVSLGPDRPKTLLVRLRHPEAKPIVSATINGQDWKDYDVQKEWVRIDHPDRQTYSIETRY